jgi:hypothetical protein
MKPVKAKVERVGGIEPPSPAWKAGVIAFIRYPLRYCFLGFNEISQLMKLLSQEVNPSLPQPRLWYGTATTIVSAILFVNPSMPVF